jgi:hypothetical protein
MANLSENTQKLIQAYAKSLQIEEDAPTIHVDEVASKVAAFYERIRGIIDWREEHLLKRRAIERILKRRLFSQIDLTEGKVSETDIAEPLVMELIRGGHFPNDKIEQIKIEEVQNIIHKYIFILNESSSDHKKSRLQLYTWLSEIAACEIEETLSPSLKERALIKYMFEAMKERIKINEKIIKEINEDEENTQIYIAVQKALFNLDAPVISYHILKNKIKDWINPFQISEIAKNIHSIKEKIDRDLEHPLADKFYQICEKHDTIFLLLGDVLAKKTNLNDFSEPEKLEILITNAYNARVKTLKKRLGRAAFYSTLSIFLTNIFSLIAIEYPATKIFTGDFKLWAIGVDILGPTLLMFLLVITIKPPNKKENLSGILIETMKVVYQGKKKDTYEIKQFPKRNFVFSTIINTIYFLGFSVILYIIIWPLRLVNFPPFSYVIFIIFLSLIAFAGAKIRQRAKELQVIEEKEGLFHFFIDPFAVPIIQLGNWFTNKWKKYNIIAVFFSALIDMPFTIFIEFIEQWRYFLKEKKEKIH